ncbi:MAG: hypothetical protein ACE5JD_01325 [Candidatus Methylomirabilia bacterium]
MVPVSFTVTLFGLAAGGLAFSLALAAFAWAWWSGQFRRLDTQARVIFEPRDYRLERPWESAIQRAERRGRYGPSEDPRPGEWGGAT